MVIVYFDLWLGLSSSDHSVPSHMSVCAAVNLNRIPTADCVDELAVFDCIQATQTVGTYGGELCNQALRREFDVCVQVFMPDQPSLNFDIPNPVRSVASANNASNHYDAVFSRKVAARSSASVFLQIASKLRSSYLL